MSDPCLCKNCNKDDATLIGIYVDGCLVRIFKPCVYLKQTWFPTNFYPKLNILVTLSRLNLSFNRKIDTRQNDKLLLTILL